MQSLTDRQLLYLDILTCDCGIPGWRAAQILGDSANLSRTIVKPLKTRGTFVTTESVIHCPGKRDTTRRGSREPKKSEFPYYINKNLDVLNKVKHDLADLNTGRIWYYENIYNREQKELQKKGFDIIPSDIDETRIPNNLLIDIFK